MKKRLLSLGLAVLMIFALAAGCSNTEEADGGNSAAPAGSGTPAASETGGETGGETNLRVAMLLSGYINDAGWNQSSYEGMLEAEEEYGVETAYTEAVAQPDFESVMRDYADQGYNLIICVGNEFSDAALAVAPSFPDTQFAVMNGNDALEPNVAAYRFNTPETGFLAGALAALYSESGVVGDIGGTTQPHIQDAINAFEAGAKYINPDITVLTGYTETMTDVAKGKEMGMAFIEQGADVLSANANSCSLGVIDAAKEAGIKHIGYISDQYEVAPGTVMTSVVQSNAFLIKAIIEASLNGEFEPTLQLFGMKEGAVYMTDYHDEDSPLTDEEKAQVDEIIAGILDGSLKEQGVLPKSTFEE